MVHLHHKQFHDKVQFRNQENLGDLYSFDFAVKTSANFLIVSSLYTTPLGLLGEFTIIAFVLQLSFLQTYQIEFENHLFWQELLLN